MNFGIPVTVTVYLDQMLWYSKVEQNPGLANDLNTLPCHERRHNDLVSTGSSLVANSLWHVN